MASRPTKYAHVTPHLPRFDGEELDRRVILNALKDEILASRGPVEGEHPSERLAQLDCDVMDLLDVHKHAAGGERYASTLTRAYVDVRLTLDALKGLQSSAQLLLDAFEELMVEQMEVEGVASQRLDSGASVSTYQEPYPQVQDKEAYRQWCVKHGFEKDMHLWPSKTASLVKEMLLAGEPEPPGVTAYAKTMVRVNKA